MAHIHFLGTSRRGGNVGNPRIKNTAHTGKLKDDLVGKLVGNSSKVPNLSGIFFPHNLSLLKHVKKTQFTNDLVAPELETSLHERFRAAG